MVSRQSGPRREATQAGPDHDGCGVCQKQLPGNLNGFNGLNRVVARFPCGAGYHSNPAGHPLVRPLGTIRRYVWPPTNGVTGADVRSHGGHPLHGWQGYRY